MMMKKNILLFALAVMSVGCKTPSLSAIDSKTEISRSLTDYQDSSRNRKIPVAIFKPTDEKKSTRIPILFSHGYGMNHGDAYINDYPYLLEALAEKGYFVVSIQHELTTDPLLSAATPIRQVRMPNWKQGALNIGFVLNQLKKNYPNLKYNKVVLIGHSNGGDQSALFTQQHPELVNKLITMDNRRMDLLRTSKPRIYTLRSNDHPADDGVLPTLEEQKKYKMVVQPTDINHDRMDKDANAKERKFIITKILEYLNEN